MKAEKIKDVSKNFRGKAWVYKVNPAVKYDYDYDKEEYIKETSYIVASAATVPLSGTETYLFPCDKDGKVLNWGELEGSSKGIYDCDAAIENAGYNVI
jgi:hypothetical protein